MVSRIVAAVHATHRTHLLVVIAILRRSVTGDAALIGTRRSYGVRVVAIARASVTRNTAHITAVKAEYLTGIVAVLGGSRSSDTACITGATAAACQRRDGTYIVAVVGISGSANTTRILTAVITLHIPKVITMVGISRIENTGNIITFYIGFIMAIVCRSAIDDTRSTVTIGIGAFDFGAPVHTIRSRTRTSGNTAHIATTGYYITLIDTICNGMATAATCNTAHSSSTSHILLIGTICNGKTTAITHNTASKIISTYFTLIDTVRDLRSCTSRTHNTAHIRATNISFIGAAFHFHFTRDTVEAGTNAHNTAHVVSTHIDLVLAVADVCSTRGMS